MHETTVIVVCVIAWAAMIAALCAGLVYGGKMMFDPKIQDEPTDEEIDAIL